MERVVARETVTGSREVFEGFLFIILFNVEKT